MAAPRGINDRIDWFLSHDPSSTGMCAQHSWHALGGDKGNPPAWGASDANECVEKVFDSGRFWTPTEWYGDPPVGAWIGWKYGNNGHAAIKHHNSGKIATTDPSNGEMVGIEGLSYPNKWGANGWTVWTDEYNNVRFPVGLTSVYLSKLIYGQEDSDSVKRLQGRLNQITLSGGEELPLSGNYLDGTMDEVSKWQKQKAIDQSVIDGSRVTEDQAYELFDDAIYTLVDDVDEEEELPETPPVEPEQVFNGFDLWTWYSGKPAGTYTLAPDGEWHSLHFVQPKSGISTDSSEHHFIYLRCELDNTRSADKVIQTKFVRSDGDATAYHHAILGTVLNSYPYMNVHFESGSGLGGEWFARLDGGTSPVKITTRYAKTHILYSKPQEF